MRPPPEPIGQKKPACPIDLFIGSRIRLARKMMHMSQEKLAQHIGITFQQIQKYEKGSSRIGAGRLHQIAVALNVPPSFFFPEPQTGEAHGDRTPPYDVREIVTFLESSEGIELSLALSQVKDVRLRRRIINLVHSIAGGDK